MGLTALFASLVPDVPNSVKVQVQRENLLAREVLFESDIKTTSEKRGNTNQTTGSPKSNAHFLHHIWQYYSMIDNSIKDRHVMYVTFFFIDDFQINEKRYLADLLFFFSIFANSVWIQLGQNSMQKLHHLESKVSFGWLCTRTDATKLSSVSEADTEMLIQNEQELSENAKNNNGDIKDDVDELDLDETYNI